MAYLLDYLESQFAPFDEAPFNPIDAAALSQVAMIRAEKVVPPLRDHPFFTHQCTILHNLVDPNLSTVHFADMLKAEFFSEMFYQVDFGLRMRCLMSLAANPRFRKLEIGDYISLLDKERQAQFAAISFISEDNFGVVAFRATDHTETGWQEDLALAFRTPLPAQEQAVQYLETVAKRLPEKIYVIGHSKGGNLAEYAAIRVAPELQKRIVAVYNLDGPGFKENYLTTSDYAPIIDRMVKIAPRDSLSAILLFSPLPLRVVPSNAAGFKEHSPFTWEIDDKSMRDFRYIPNLSENSIILGDTIRAWIVRYDLADRERIVKALFHVVSASGDGTIGDLFTGGVDALARFIKDASPSDKADVATVLQAAESFVDEMTIVSNQRLQKRLALALGTTPSTDQKADWHA